VVIRVSEGEREGGEREQRASEGKGSESSEER
jgi:hypothetical protein